MSRFFRAAGDSDSESESDEESLISSGEDEAPQQAPKPKIGMSRFLRTESGDESSSSSESEEEDEDEDEDEEKPKPRPGGRFGWGADEDDESDDEKVVVKSARDKRMEELEVCGKAIDNAVKINDWIAISNEFDKLGRLVQRQINLQEPTPPLYFRHLVGLDKAIQAASAKEKEKDAKKKMNANVARALANMKQKLKKAMKENEKDLSAYNNDSEAFETKYNDAIAA
ncbi:Translation initiation factor 3 subunit c, partial [Tulasnella sp. 403]